MAQQKDRVTGHNPAVPLYLSDRFYKAKLYPPTEQGQKEKSTKL